MSNSIATQDILSAKIALVTRVTNQLIPTIYTVKHNITKKVKLLTEVPGLVLKYNLDSREGNFNLIENDKYLTVIRQNDGESSAILSVDIFDEDGKTLLLTHAWNMSLLSTSDAQTTKLEELHYNNNKFSQMLGYVAIVFLVLNTLFTLNTVKPTFLVAFIYVIVTIFMLLFGFLCCEKVKAYKKNYAIGLGALGLITFVLIFLLPLQTIIQYNAYHSASLAGDTQAMADIANKYLGAALTDASNVSNMLTQNGYIRSIVMIILLGVCTALFMLAAVAGYMKSIKLAKFLASTRENK